MAEAVAVNPDKDLGGRVTVLSNLLAVMCTTCTVNAAKGT